MEPLSFGEQVVRKSFNPSESADVKSAKRLSADLIDFAHDFKAARGSEISTEELLLIGRAIQSFEIGCMWLVKALTVEQSR